jgi:hypothetical protein
MASTLDIRGNARLGRADTLALELASTLAWSSATVAVDYSGLTDRVSCVVALRRLAHEGRLDDEWTARALQRARQLHAECEALLGPED